MLVPLILVTIDTVVHTQRTVVCVCVYHIKACHAAPVSHDHHPAPSAFPPLRHQADYQSVSLSERKGRSSLSHQGSSAVEPPTGVDQLIVK